MAAARGMDWTGRGGGGGGGARGGGALHCISLAFRHELDGWVSNFPFSSFRLSSAFRCESSAADSLYNHKQKIENDSEIP